MFIMQVFNKAALFAYYCSAVVVSFIQLLPYVFARTPGSVLAEIDSLMYP